MRHRLHWKIASRFVHPDRLIFLDESGAKTNMVRRYGRSPVGQRCVDQTPQGHWRTMTMLSAIRAEGVIKEATAVVDGPMSGPLFLAYVERFLTRSLRPGEVVVMDNLAAHKVKGVREAIEAAGCDLWYLPAYSPDLNPIEMVWSKVKAYLRRVSARTWDKLVNAVAGALSAVSPQDCANFISCQYQRANYSRETL